MTQIWVDADACPRAVKEVIYRAARRTQMVTTLVANQMLLTPPSPFIKAIQVPAGMDVADNEIVRRVSQQDLGLWRTFRWRKQIVEMDALALNPRGEWYTRENVRALLSMRDFAAAFARLRARKPAVRRHYRLAMYRRLPMLGWLAGETTLIKQH